MSIRKFLASAFFLGAVLISNSVNAQFYTPQRCDTCTTSADFKARALAAGQGHHLVYNLPGNKIEYWHVVVDRPGPGGPGGPENPRAVGPSAVGPMSGARAESRVVPAAASEEFNKARTLHVIGGGTLRPIINVPISYLDVYPSVGSKTAYDFVNDYNMKGMIESAAGDAELISEIVGSNLLTALADLKGLATSLVGLKNQADLIFRIVMTDGSSVDIRIRLDHPNGEYLAESARTAGGQPIPENVHQIQGEWTNEGGDDLQPLVNHFAHLGATIHYYGPSNGVIRTTVCSGSGAQRICEVELVFR